MKKALLAFLFILLLAACSNDTPEEEVERVTPVETADVREGTFTVNREVIAQSSPAATSAVVPETPGEITFISVAKGDRVTEGDALAEVTPQQGESQVELQENALAQARQQLSQAQSSREEAQEAVNDARDQKESAGNGFLGPSEQELEAQVSQAEQQLDQAESSVEQARLQVEQAQIQLEQAQDQAAPETITAPRSGIVTSIEGNVGDIATNQQPFMTIVATDPAVITASIPAGQLPLFQENESYRTAMDVLANPNEATVTYVSSVPGDTGLYDVEAEIPNPNNVIKPGMMATLLLPETVVDNTIIIPTEALVQTSEEAYVYKIEEDTAVQVPVSVEASQTEESAVTGDLDEGDRIVTSGQITLTDGATIRVIGEDE
ncbi:efflux RND transporter periplasmic adaptor subunit [Salimicrobium halophilum]|uniref:RND family efflux transporter, MFP subunit n=1 Tax=Salimicrobium halophilum TaxID=86666 RepID=A0A1G8SGV9_9BACI|nr:efflux RND transporter periplasmic adaptor subunit [Salimicrobium halophilum]SDJ27890.1 RND family efflux transporter, MFP subunit [Salimicrobium halophilum]